MWKKLMSSFLDFELKRCVLCGMRTKGNQHKSTCEGFPLLSLLHNFFISFESNFPSQQRKKKFDRKEIWKKCKENDNLFFFFCYNVHKDKSNRSISCTRTYREHTIYFPKGNSMKIDRAKLFQTFDDYQNLSLMRVNNFASESFNDKSIVWKEK